MFTVSRRDLGELLALFRLVEEMSVPEATAEGKAAEQCVEFEAVMREEEKVMKCYRREGNEVLIESSDSDETVRLDIEEWRSAANGFFEALRQNDDENLVLVDDAEEAFLDKAKIYSIAGTGEGQNHLLLATAAGLQPVGVWLRVGAFPTKVLDGGRSANLKLEQTGARFATPMAAKVNALTSAATVRDRMWLIEEMGSSLRYSNVADKVFRANCAMIDLHLGRLLTEMVRLSYIEDVVRLDELVQRMNEMNPLKVKSELIEKHGFYEYKLKQLLMACAAGMRPAKIYTGVEDLPAYRLIVNPDGRPVVFPGGERARLADFLFHHTRLERGSMEKDKYGELERENNVYYFKLNLKIGLTKR